MKFRMAAKRSVMNHYVICLCVCVHNVRVIFVFFERGVMYLSL